MTTVNTRAALETHLNGMTPSLATAFENVAYTPVTGTPYQRVNLLTAEPENPSIGAVLQRDQGIFMVALKYPPNAGSQAAMSRAELIRARFPRGLALSHGPDVVHINRTPAISIPPAEADRYVVIVSIRYHVNTFTP